MKVLRLKHDFNQEAVKQMSLDEFAKAYENSISPELIQPAYEAITGFKSAKKSKSKKKSSGKVS